MFNTIEIGRSVRGAAIFSHSAGDGPDTTLFLGAHHGAEPQGVVMLRRLMEELAARPMLLEGRRVVVVPELNPDGVADGTRGNANGVDLNRNLPTADWRRRKAPGRYYPGDAPASEPETQALMALVEQTRPDIIVTIHAPLRCNNWNGLARRDAERGRFSAEAVAEAMAASNGYPVTGDVGYPCPGSFGTWAGRERGIATITLELGPDTDGEQGWRQNQEALLAALLFLRRDC